MYTTWIKFNKNTFFYLAVFVIEGDIYVTWSDVVHYNYSSQLEFEDQSQEEGFIPVSHLSKQQVSNAQFPHC